ncbi:MAG: putative nucleic acid-binding protein [Verrucomicrobiales bacterium]
MAILIDTNVFTAAERCKHAGKLAELLDQIPAEKKTEDAVISVITASELLMSVRRATDDRIRERRSAFVEAILDRFTALPIDIRIAREHSRIVAELLNSGQKIGTHDSWIAASASAYGFSIATNNVDEFSRVPELEVVTISV